ncbi:hypothetical protein [Paenibacillus sp. BC26]|uniref:hypothetical protein n=1 Tax=Paenibacillus sp. BC26 TaxID=1881032 RepID=UPI001160CC5B|nr:hypothetical protein [Paenibacillus sp. BC26]
MQTRLSIWQVITGLFIVLLIIEAVVLPYGSSKLNDYSGSAGILDLRLSYSVDKAYAIIGAYSDAGRAFYVTFTLTADFIYPIVYSLFFALLTTVIYRRAFAPKSWAHQLPLLIYITLLLDYLENACIVTMLTQYPDQITFIAKASSLFTTLKWMMAAISVLLLLLGVVMLIVKRLRKTH